MQHGKLSGVLSKLGLKGLEIEVFLASLQVGTGPASVIAGVAGLGRVTTYEVLGRLSRKGFVKTRAKKGSKVKYYTPEDVQDIKAKLQDRVAELESSIAQIGDIKDEFSSLYRSSENKPVVLYYEGKEGIKSVLNDSLLQRPKEILSFASVDWLNTELHHEGYIKQYWAGRVARKIPCRCIMPETEKARELMTPEKNAAELRTIRFINPAIYDFRTNLDVYDDNINLISFEPGKEHSIIIRSKSIAQGMRAVFNTLWELSKTS